MSRNKIGKSPKLTKKQRKQIEKQKEPNNLGQEEKK
jgi:hypothetical protein